MQAQLQATSVKSYYLKSIWSVAICAAVLGIAGGGSNSLAVCLLAVLGVEIRSQYLTSCAYKACTVCLIFDIIYLAALTITNGWWVLTFGSFGIIFKFIMIYFGKKYLEDDLQNGLIASGGGDGEYREPTLHASGDSEPQNIAVDQHQQQQNQYQQMVPKAVAVVGGYQSAL
jgi:hypothetical protein